MHGKKYITRRVYNKENLPSEYSYIEDYIYYNLLNTYEDESGDTKCRYLCRRVIGHSYEWPYSKLTMGDKLDYEEHILEVYPELANFVNDMVPDAYLKKIYYEINDLSSKKLVKN